ncbi:MAG: acetyltransferase [Lentisphaerae bacterium]|nr:acetyltransferase [Lentisphaerota bacterium]
MAKRLFQRINRRIAIGEGVAVGNHVHIGPGTLIEAPRDTLTIEDHVFIGNSCTIQTPGRIGKYTMISNSVGIVGRMDHDFHVVGKPMRLAPWVGDIKNYTDWPDASVDIGEDVWVGYGAIILSGISVGRGAIVAAGAVVTKDVSPYAVVAGNPAILKKMRFTEDEITEHERLISRGALDDR